jgi:hypothetical protein
MTRAFCTLFASNYLVQGLVMMESVREWDRESEFVVLCMDDPCYETLGRLAVPGVFRLNFNELKDAALERACADRSLGETCWTCTPVVCEWVFSNRPSVEYVVYVDADLMFFDSPSRMADELGAGSVLIFEHRFPPERATDATVVGRFCVEVIVFRNDRNGRECLEWWRERCLEWCYHRVEPGRMADQKYLDEWPKRFGGVVVAGKELATAAPWNFAGQTFARDIAGRLLSGGVRLLYLHFSKFRVYWKEHYIPVIGYAIPNLLAGVAYAEYMRRLDDVWDRIWSVDPGFSGGLARPGRLDWAFHPERDGFLPWLGRTERRIRGALRRRLAWGRNRTARA